MIEEITFEQIIEIWKEKLWAKYVESGYTINPVNVTTQKDYCYRAIEHISNVRLLARVLKPTYIGYFVGDKIIAVESGYKTNTDYYRVRGLWVDENYRGLGIATQLIRWFEMRCKEKYLWTIPRESSLRFYLKYGFLVTGISAKTIYGQNYFAVKERDIL